MKKAFLLAAGAAFEKYGDRLADQQEIVAALSNILMDCYALESSVRRAQKAEASPKPQAAALMADAARVILDEGAGRVEHEARRVLAAVLEGDMLRTQLAVLRRFLKRDAPHTIAMRQRIGAAVRAADQYPFEAR